MVKRIVKYAMDCAIGTVTGVPDQKGKSRTKRALWDSTKAEPCATITHAWIN
jgi:hypothetical protein